MIMLEAGLSNRGTPTSGGPRQRDITESAGASAQWTIMAQAADCWLLQPLNPIPGAPLNSHPYGQHIQ